MSWLNSWCGETAVIVASGPSAATTHVELAKGQAKVIAVNSSWQLVPWADALYSCDAAWWFHHHGVLEFAGQKFTSSPTAAQAFGIHLFSTAGSNSGLRAIRLAEKLGAVRVLLVGFDMHCGGGVHWHEPHTGKMRNPGVNNMAIWRTEMERQRRTLKPRIINCTPGSALTCFDFLEFAQAINGCISQAGTDQPRYSGVPG